MALCADQEKKSPCRPAKRFHVCSLSESSISDVCVLKLVQGSYLTHISALKRDDDHFAGGVITTSERWGEMRVS